MSVAEVIPSISVPKRKHWSGAEYDRLVELGAFDHLRIELIDGEIYEMSPMNDPHSQAITLVQNALLRRFDMDHYTVKVQCPLRLGETSRPEPDAAVLAGPVRQHFEHPKTALLVIEVAESTLDYDRSHKGPLYARNGIADYWIVNLIQRCVEVYRYPQGQTQTYGQPVIHMPGQQVAPLAMPSAAIAVADLLP